MFLKKSEYKYKLRPALNRENTQPQPYYSPGRGWYHIYTFCPGKKDVEQLKWLPLEEQESLVLLRLDIGQFREKEIDRDTLLFTEMILKRFQNAKKDIILRICYDTNGNGLASEPSTLMRVMEHMNQLGPVVSTYAKSILVSQGIFIGSWGEMHSSKFMHPKQIQKLTETWRQATSGMIRIALRKPAFTRMMYAPEEKTDVYGLYNDAMLADDTDMGTFGNASREESVWTDAWCMEDELHYMHKQMTQVPLGGEVLSSQVERNISSEVISYLRKMQVSYLNSIYDPRFLDMWKEIKVEDGESLYDYVGNHLGYRLEVKRMVWKKRQLMFVVVNTGFAPLYDRCKARIIAKGTDGDVAYMDIGMDFGNMLPDEQRDVVMDFSCLVKDSAYELYLETRRRKDNARICFVGQQKDRELYLGRLDAV